MRKNLIKSIAKRHEIIRWREFGDHGILLNPASGDYFEISEAGLIIWKQIDGQRTVEEIINELATHFVVEGEDLTKDVAEFIEDLMGNGLISTELMQEESRD